MLNRAFDFPLNISTILRIEYVNYNLYNILLSLLVKKIIISGLQSIFSASNSSHMISRLSHFKSRYDLIREKHFPLGVSIQQIYCPLNEV